EGEKVSGVVAAKYLPINAASQAIATGDPAPVCKSGIVLVEAGGVLADLGEVMTDNQGRAIAFDDNIAKYAVGKVVSSSAAQAGDIVAVELYALDAQRKGATP
ncbi:MAG TPA: hypothetical protein VNL91_04140, partial [Thermoanaerobaculia bacterium]|nr:hypothetical protein [Thermoanaerobaculia bacterium]